jgi:hypothetical protein
VAPGVDDAVIAVHRHAQRSGVAGLSGDGAEVEHGGGSRRGCDQLIIVEGARLESEHGGLVHVALSRLLPAVCEDGDGGVRVEGHVGRGEAVLHIGDGRALHGDVVHPEIVLTLTEREVDLLRLDSGRGHQRGGEESRHGEKGESEEGHDE